MLRISDRREDRTLFEVDMVSTLRLGKLAVQIALYASAFFFGQSTELGAPTTAAGFQLKSCCTGHGNERPVLDPFTRNLHPRLPYDNALVFSSVPYGSPLAVPHGIAACEQT